MYISKPQHYQDGKSVNRAADMNILIVNPNSTQSMTEGLKPLLADLASANLSLHFFTAPSDAPPSIDDARTSALSTSVTFSALQSILKDARSSESTDVKIRYSGYLVACFSSHPLTPLLRSRTTAPVLNIFEAALLHARALAMPFGIVTTGQYWEAVLENGAKEFFSGRDVDNATTSPATDEINVAGFVGVRSTGLTAAQLHLTEREVVDRRIADASADLVGQGARAIILGCAGMSGMEDAIRVGAQRHGREVRIIDGVRAGVVLLEGLVKTNAV
ncbi:hypothetical protein EIP91_006531 [Steccherinum ochraceum]|uniref:Asp/Glu/hydantoin racemase n=1 Tax=Steccherinum ochraceum TaxID=92696 RepID=A0A4R0R838_9APHY|nr:hypothetical protein EIP91_006531 [Steccherinum ochraceum]